MADQDLEQLARKLKRERKAREDAESLLEEKARELYLANRRLESLLDDLELQVQERTAELRLALDDAKNASRVKSDFLAMVSHEIRTPMNVVLGMTELLLDSPVDSQQHSMLSSIHDSSKALLEIINDLLDLSSIEAGKIGIDHVSFDLNDTLKSVINGLAYRANSKGLALRSDITEGMGRFFGDPWRIRQVLVNLISNAIKYTDNGSVTVKVERLSRVEGHTRLRCTVTDTGPGIPAEFQASLFDSYQRFHAKNQQAKEGTGLGLALCRQLIELLDGTIGVESEPGKGSAFWFVLTLVDDHDVPESIVDPKVAVLSTAPRRDSLRILVAEDNKANQAVARLMLEKMGHQVDMADDGEAAVEAAKSNDYDVILMDLQMPGMDGAQAARAIRSLDNAVAKIPIIALTANAMASDRERCLDAGMTGFAAKPLSRAALVRALEEL